MRELLIHKASLLLFLSGSPISVPIGSGKAVNRVRTKDKTSKILEDQADIMPFSELVKFSS